MTVSFENININEKENARLLVVKRSITVQKLKTVLKIKTRSHFYKTTDPNLQSYCSSLINHRSNYQTIIVQSQELITIMWFLCIRENRINRQNKRAAARSQSKWFFSSRLYVQVSIPWRTVSTPPYSVHTIQYYSLSVNVAARLHMKTCFEIRFLATGKWIFLFSGQFRICFRGHSTSSHRLGQTNWLYFILATKLAYHNHVRTDRL